MPDWDSPLYSPVIWPGSPCYNPPFRTSGVCNLTKTMDKGLALLKLLPACQEHNPTCPLVQGFLSKKKKKRGSGVEGRIHKRQKNLAEYTSAGCPWKAACAMSKGWHCWTSWHPHRILELADLVRRLEGTAKTVTAK